MDQQVVIRRPLGKNILFILACAAFVGAGILILHVESEDAFYRLIAIIAIVFFGGGGLLHVALKMWKPVIMISDKGITVPQWRGENVVPWENIKKIKVVTQYVGGRNQKYIGIFVFDSKNIVGADKVSKGLRKIGANWTEMPAILLTPSFSFDIKEVMGILQEFHDKHKTTRIR